MNAEIFNISKNQITDFCKRWKIIEFAAFGSVLREDFGPESDLDIIITFSSDADWSLFDHLRMEKELERILNRKIDLFTKKSVEQDHNWIRRKEILETAEVVYAAR